MQLDIMLKFMFIVEVYAEGDFTILDLFFSLLLYNQH